MKTLLKIIFVLALTCIFTNRVEAQLKNYQQVEDNAWKVKQKKDPFDKTKDAKIYKKSRYSYEQDAYEASYKDKSSQVYEGFVPISVYTVRYKSGVLESRLKGRMDIKASQKDAKKKIAKNPKSKKVKKINNPFVLEEIKKRNKNL